MNTKTQELATVTIAGAVYTVEHWEGWGDVIISRKGTPYTVEQGLTQPVSFPGGSPLRSKGNAVRVMNVGGIIEEVKK